MPNDQDGRPARSLVRRGLLPGAPTSPRLAYSLHLLELYRTLSRRYSRYPIQSFIRALCDSLNTPYDSALRTTFAQALDVYYELLRRIDNQVLHSLGRDTPDWRVKNGCPCCRYKQPDEPPLKFSQLIAIDGNSSLKRFGDAGLADTRTFSSDYYLSRDYVNQFENEGVKRGRNGGKRKRPAGKGKGKSRKKADRNAEEEWVDTDTDDENGDGDEDEDHVDANLETQATAPLPTVGWLADTIEGLAPKQVEGLAAGCAERWKANAPDSEKGMFRCFEESGVFVGICRHHIVLFVMDMVESGEL